MKDKLTPKVVAALGVAALAVVALIGWFGLVSPQRSKAAGLDQKIADAQSQLVVIKATARTGSKDKLPSGLVLTRAISEDSPIREWALKSTRSPRLGAPADIASAVAFLMSSDGEWIDGQVLSVDGGATLR